MSNYPRDKRRSWPARAVRAAAALVPAAALALGSGLAVTAVHAEDPQPEDYGVTLTLTPTPDHINVGIGTIAFKIKAHRDDSSAYTFSDLMVECGGVEPVAMGDDVLNNDYPNAFGNFDYTITEADKQTYPNVPVACTVSGKWIDASSGSGDFSMTETVELKNGILRPAYQLMDLNEKTFVTDEEFDQIHFQVNNNTPVPVDGMKVDFTYGDAASVELGVGPIPAESGVPVKLPTAVRDAVKTNGQVPYTAVLKSSVGVEQARVSGTLLHPAIRVAIDPTWAEKNSEFKNQSEILAPPFTVTNSTAEALEGAKLRIPELGIADIDVPTVPADGKPVEVRTSGGKLPDVAFFDGEWDFSAIVYTGETVHGTSMPHVMKRVGEPKLGLTTRVLDEDGKEIAKPEYKTLGQKVTVEASFTNAGDADAFAIAHTTPSFTIDGIAPDPATGNSLVGVVPAGEVATLKTFHYVTQPEDLAHEVESISPAITYWDNALGKGDSPLSTATTLAKGAAITTDPIDLDDIQVTTVPQEVTVEYSLTNTTDQVFTDVLPASDLVEITGKPVTVNPGKTVKLEVTLTVTDAAIAKMEDGKLSIPTYLQVTQEPVKTPDTSGANRFAAATTLVGALLPMPGTTAPDPNSYRIASQTLDIPVNLSPAPNPNPGSTTSKGSTAKTGAQVAAAAAIAVMSLALGASLVYKGRRRDV